MHCSQGATFNFPFSIYEYKYYDKNLSYTPISRSTEKAHIHFKAYHPKTLKGCIYKITDTNSKCYIGSTTQDPDKRCKQHREAKQKMPLHEEIRKKRM